MGRIPVKCCDLTSGKLRHQILIERSTKTDDGGGGSTAVWLTHLSTRAFIKPISGGERLQALRVESDITQRIFIRYRTGLLPSDRINYGGRIMEIKAILNLEERNQWFEIYATEGPAT